MKKKALRIGIVFDSPQDYAFVSGPEDRFAEFEPESTIEMMEEAIGLLGHTPVRLGGPRSLLSERPEVDILWNIAEGYGTRNREGWAPILAECWNIPCLGSDALALSLTLDKWRTKQIAKMIGVPVTETFLFQHEQAFPVAQTFPLLLKPRYEGTAKGISQTSIVTSVQDAHLRAAQLMQQYHQDILGEPFLPGAEFTLTLTGNPPKVHPVIERALDAKTKLGNHVVGRVEESELITFEQLDSELEARLAGYGVALWRELELRDYARFDFKCDANGNPYFLEVNPLPTFATDSTFAILAELEGKSYPIFLSEILDSVLQSAKGRF